MYNESIKLGFIDVYLDIRIASEGTMKSIFIASEKFEMMANNGEGKDICNFTKIELDDFFMGLGAKSKERLCVINSILKEYKNYCIDNGLCFDKTPYHDMYMIDNFKKFISKNVLENKYINEEALRSYMEELDNPCDKLLLLLLYKGIKGKQLVEIINLNVNQIDGNILHLSTGRDVEVDDEVIKLIKETNETYDYISYAETGRCWKLYGENVFKEKAGSSATSLTSLYHRYSIRIMQFQKMFDNPELAINRIGVSGMLNALVNGAKEKDMCIREFLLSDYAKPIFERYGFNRYPTKVLSLYSEYLEYIQ